jgi:hypothetical protein
MDRVYSRHDEDEKCIYRVGREEVTAVRRLQQ